MDKRSYIFSAAFLGMLIFGIVMAVLGAILPSVIVRFGLDEADAGSLFLLMNFGMLLGSLVFGPIVDRYGYKGLLLVCTTLVFLGFIGISQLPTVEWLRVSIFFVGFGGGMINGGTNALVSDLSTESRSSGLSYLGVFFGIGAFGIPFVLGTLLDIFEYMEIIGGVGALLLLPLIFFALIRFPEPKQKQGFPLKQALGLTKEGKLLLFGLILFLQSGLEMTVGGWAAEYLHQEMGFASGRAVIMLSLFWLGLCLARLAGGKILMYVSPALVLQVSLGISIIGSVILLTAQHPYLAVTGLVLLGIGFAIVFPAVLGFVGDAYPQLSGTAFSVVLVMALTGGMLLPWITGLLASAFDLRSALVIIPGAVVGVFIIFRIVHSLMQKEKNEAE